MAATRIVRAALLLPALPILGLAWLAACLAAAVTVGLRRGARISTIN